MRWLAVLPAVNAVLIFSSGIMLLRGGAAIRRGERELHRRLMLIATTLATTFFILYVTRISLGGLTTFHGPAWARALYLFVLVTHVSMALVQLPLAAVTLWRAHKGRFASHKRIARITYPIWVYVSFTGVLVYGLLHYPY